MAPGQELGLWCLGLKCMGGSMPWADKPCPETALLLVDVLLLLLLMLLLLPVFLVSQLRPMCLQRTR